MNCLNLYCFSRYFSLAIFISSNSAHIYLVLLLLTHCPSCAGQETLCKGFISKPVVLTINGCFQEPGVESAVYQGTHQNDTWTHLLCMDPDG